MKLFCLFKCFFDKIVKFNSMVSGLKFDSLVLKSLIRKRIK